MRRGRRCDGAAPARVRQARRSGADAMQQENEKLRELVELLQEKLTDVDDGYA